MFSIISGIHSTVGHRPPPSPRDVSGQRGRVEGHRPTETQKGQDDRRGDHGQAQYVTLYVLLCANLPFCETQTCSFSDRNHRQYWRPKKEIYAIREDRTRVGLTVLHNMFMLVDGGL